MTGAIDAYVRLLRRGKWFVIGFWVVAALVSAVFVPGLMDVTSLDFFAPEGTEARTGRDAFNKYFPQYSKRSGLAILFQSKDGGSLLDNDNARNATYEIQKAAMTDKEADFVLSFMSYFTLADQGSPDTILSKYLTKDNKTCQIQISVIERHTGRSKGYCNRMQKVLDRVEKHYNLKVYRTGQDWLMEDFTLATLKEMIVTDSISSVIAFAVLAIMLRSITLLVIPLVNLLISALTSMAFLYAMAASTTVAGFAPAIMLAVLLAMAVDYSLFLLKRFRQEIDKMEVEDMSERYDEAITTMLTNAGRVVLVSGATLAVAFLGLLLAGIEFMSTLGGGAAIAVCCTILTNLTLTPTLLIAFPRFFSAKGLCPCFTKKQENDEYSPVEEKAPEDNAWRRISIITTTTEGSIIVLVLSGLMLLPSLYATRFFKISVDNALMFPSSLAAEKANELLAKEFTAGSVNPFFFVAIAPSGGTVLSKQFWNESTALYNKLVQSDTVAPEDIICISSAYGVNISYVEAKLLLKSNSTAGKEYQDFYYQLTERNNKATYCVVSVKFNPSVGTQVNDWIDWSRGLLKSIEVENSNEWHVVSDIVDEIDACNSVYDKFAEIVGITCCVMVIVVAIAFRSVVLPFRLLFTVGLTAASTFGVAVFVYCTPALDFIPTIKHEGIYWFPPILVLFVIIGLGIDYDVFLFSRVTEFFLDDGLHTDEAICLGCQNTGGVITGAGTVMAVAFSGLMLSSNPALQTIGLFLVIAVLLDTFLIRLLVVPSLLHLLNEANWWPIRQKQSNSSIQSIQSTF